MEWWIESAAGVPRRSPGEGGRAALKESVDTEPRVAEIGRMLGGMIRAPDKFLLH